MEPCRVAVNPISPARFTDLPAGSWVRVGAQVLGRSLQTKPVLRWQVTSSGRAITHRVIEGQPTEIEFPTMMPGLYEVRATVEGETPPCEAVATFEAITPNQRIETFWLRVTPPTSRTLPMTVGGNPLGIHEAPVNVQAGTRTLEKDLDFQVEREVKVEPVDHTGTVLPAYFVQIWSPNVTARHEGYITSGVGGERGFTALLYGDGYNVLVIPDGTSPVRAPILYPSRTRTGLYTATYRIDEGAPFAGNIVLAGAPLPNARVRLRDGLLMSTVGKADALGAFRLRLRPDGRRFEARVIPPDDSGLPEALLPQETGVMIGSAGLAGVIISYTSTPAVALTMNVTTAEGGAAPTPTKVYVESLADEFAQVATLSVPGQGDLSLRGKVRVMRETSAGMVSFAKLPRGRYRVTAVPPDGPVGSAAMTTLPLVDLTAGGATIAQPLVMAKRGQISGTLTPATKAEGLTVRAVDDVADDSFSRTTIVNVDNQGRYVVASDPGRSYRLFVEPAADRRVPRLALEPTVRATSATVTVEPRALPNRVSLTGKVKATGTAVPGAIVQAFCLGSNVPTCVNLQAADVSATLPIDETVSGADGSYQLWLPDPGPPAP
jgi:hypothetical protein